MNFIINTIPTSSPGGKRPAATDTLAYGRYVTTFASCVECHTQRDGQGNPVPGMNFAGGSPFSLPTGTVYSANITPAKTGVGSWTRDAFIARFKAYANGNVQPDVLKGERNSVMPWTMYAGMSEQDLGAIYDYLHTLKPVEVKSPAFVPNAKLVANR